MVQYIYNTYIEYQDTVNRTDFETNYKTIAKGFSDIKIGDTTFTLELEYTNFKTLIDGITITWADVRYIEGISDGTTDYELYLITNNPL